LKKSAMNQDPIQREVLPIPDIPKVG